MKTKEQKRAEANQRHQEHLKRILEIGKLNYLNERLSKLDSKLGKSFSEKKRLMKQIESYPYNENKKTFFPSVENADVLTLTVEKQKTKTIKDSIKKN